jgi:hypothetical protein
MPIANPGLPSELWELLNGKLWHATGRSQLDGIIRDGEIRIFRNRYNNSVCKAHEAVSLFDFGPSASDHHQFDNWAGWLGHQQKSRVAVWLEIDRQRISEYLYDASGALALRGSNFSQNIIPGVEACHKGSISTDAIKSVLLIDQHHGHAKFKECSWASAGITGALLEFEQSLLPPPPDSELVMAMKAAGLIRE